MHTAQFQNDGAANFAAKIIDGIRTLFGAGDTLADALAAACANDIRRQRGLAAWVGSLAGMSRRRRAALLVRSAAGFRGEWVTAGLVDTLMRLASRPALFRATLRELRAAHCQRRSPMPCEMRTPRHGGITS